MVAGLFLLSTAGCSLLPGPPAQPTATQALILPSPDSSGGQPTPGITVIPITPLAPIEPTATAGLPPVPTDTPPPSATPTVGPSPTGLPTATGLPSATPSGPRLDPVANWGVANLTDPLDSDANWLSADGTLANTDFLHLEHVGSQLLVTGKQLLFETWWFTWPVLSDFYLEITVQTAACTDSDAYGMIFRGSERGAPTVRGYLALLTCDGLYRLRRLDAATPTYTASDLIPSTQSTAIRSGPNQTNVLGIQAVGNTLTLYANGYRLAEYTDTTFRSGRFGLLVRSGSAAPYTFRLEELRYWDLSD
jgi:hypothetical protein